jgi:hypothetical protein
MSKKSTPSKSVKKSQPFKSKAAPKGKPISEPMKAGLKAVATMPGTKLGKLVALLSRPNGATVEEMAAENGWQKHTVRSAISHTLVKKHGYEVVSEKLEGGKRHYMIKSGAKTVAK